MTESSIALPCEEAVALARRTLALIRSNRALWNQRHWYSKWPLFRDRVSLPEESQAPECGVTGCFAGWAALLDGQTVRQTDYCVQLDGLEGSDLPDLMTVGRWAAERLGLPAMTEDRQHMFAGDNTIEDLEEWVDVMAEACERGITVEKVAIERGLRTEQAAEDVPF